MGDTDEPIVETQEVIVQSVPKKPRSEAQLAALEAARKKAYAMRAEKAALRKHDEASKALAKVEAQKPITLDTTQHPKEADPKDQVEEEEEEEVIYRKKPPKRKRVVVVQEESSSDSEIEVRLPKARPQPIAKPKNHDELRYEKAYNRLFSIDTL
jgi:hypothetical protein